MRQYHPGRCRRIRLARRICLFLGEFLRRPPVNALRPVPQIDTLGSSNVEEGNWCSCPWNGIGTEVPEEVLGKRLRVIVVIPRDRSVAAGIDPCKRGVVESEITQLDRIVRRPDERLVAPPSPPERELPMHIADQSPNVACCNTSAKRLAACCPIFAQARGNRVPHATSPARTHLTGFRKSIQSVSASVF